MENNDYYNELKRKLKEFRSLRNKVSSDKLAILDYDISTLMDNLKQPRKIKVTLEEVLFREYQNLISSENLWRYCEELSRYVCDDIPKFPYPYLVLSYSDILELTHDFFKNVISKEIYSLFLKLYKQRKNFFIHSEDVGFHGDSLYLQYDESFYTRLEKKNEFADISTMAHEYGHGIQFLTNFNGTLLNSLYAFHEIVSTFFELLCIEYYAKDTEIGKKAIAANYEFWNIICESAFSLTRELQILKLIKNNSSKNPRSVRKSIDFFTKHSDSDELSDIVEVCPSQDFIYIIGYVFAVELYLIYEKDQDYAFYLLKKLMEIDLRLDAHEHLKEILKLGIIPTANLGTFDNHLKR